MTITLPNNYLVHLPVK